MWRAALLLALAACAAAQGEAPAWRFGPVRRAAGPPAPSAPPAPPDTSLQVNSTHVIPPDSTTVNSTATDSPLQKIDITKPGVLKRGLLVFGGFALLALAYLGYSRTKRNKNESSNITNPSDGPQFRYGVLQMEDRNDNLELSHVPLTMDSEEDEDDDLEIFDLEQKKKSLSYVNLQSDDAEAMNRSAIEDILTANEAGGSRDKDQLLLDIDDRSTATLIPFNTNKDSSVI